MFEQFFSYRILAKLINSALALDPDAREKLSVLNGRRISILPDFRSDPWIAEIRDGQLQFCEVRDMPCDVRLSGTLAGFLQLFRPATNMPAARAKLYIEGDLHAAQQFQRVMAELQPDFDRVLRQQFGDSLGAVLADAARTLQEQGEKAKNSVGEKIRTFLADNSIRRDEWQAFTRRISALEQRIQTAERLVDSRTGEGQ